MRTTMTMTSRLATTKTRWRNRLISYPSTLSGQCHGARALYKNLRYVTTWWMEVPALGVCERGNGYRSTLSCMGQST